jgi:hypothetical protein
MSLHVYDELAQGSEEWHDARRGIVTASTVGKLVATGPPDALSVACTKCEAQVDDPCMSLAAKKEPAPIKTIHDARTLAAANLPPVYTVANNDTSRALTATLVAERIAGWTEDGPMTSDMWRGVECEPIARNYYSEHHAPVTEVGFMRLDEDWGTLGYSPDGLVGDEGLIEIKAPRTKGHLVAVLSDEVPAHNMAQLQAGLLVSGREWVDYIPFVGGLPLWIKRVHPDPKWFEVIRAAVVQFEETATEMVAAYTEATEGLAPTERVLDMEMSL